MMATKLGTSGGVLVVAVIALVGAAAGGIVGALGNTEPSADAAGCHTGATAAQQVAGLSGEQMDHAATIVAVGRQQGVPRRGWVVAIAAALQESRLRNLDYGDRDSLGLFQQRPSMGWGTPQQITTPSYAATQFYTHLKAIPGWQDMSITDAAQAVQRSGFPNAYAQHEPTARTIVAALTDVRCQPVSATTGTGNCATIHAPTAAARTAINYACGQRGLPYVWGGNGPDGGHSGFDCSGLTKAAYRAAGIDLPRTAHTQYHSGTLVPDGQPLHPGDLVHYGTPAHIHHVGLYIGNGKMIHAPDFGEVVKISNYRYPGDEYAGATRPTK
ncbi:cell wall-associated NlpC family hydrolase [Prauserella sediminis]|uniref:Cell wall-associated NlpC family hydrolase n=1 Tax=Prauserella sediminis TaxID=577680 RepID=A0A839XSM2_9PSEU|nr:C40 family peptidase [Prauserella sediminis]MBB3666200.1 cell wall-associated NlpC family hydrolase [Prauserella sediminis]